MLEVVVIDANAISRGLLTTVLADGGHNVVGSSNTSPAGLVKMINLQPQLVCVDIGFAEDGMAILDTLREALPKAIIFLVSGEIAPATVDGALKRGVHGFIVKPFNSKTVLGIIKNVILKLIKQQQAKSSAQESSVE